MIPEHALANVRKTLRGNALFAHMSADDLELVEEIAEIKQLVTGETLFQEGDRVENTYIVSAGLLRVYQVGPRGSRRLILHMAGPPESIGEVAVLSERRFYPVTAEAVLDSRVIQISRRGLVRLMEERPGLTRMVLRAVSERQFELLLLLRRMAFFEVQSRLALYLLERHKAAGPGFQLPKNPDLAAQLGTVPEIISRTLNRFFKQGLIRLENRRVWIEKEAVLIAVAKG